VKILEGAAFATGNNFWANLSLDRGIAVNDSCNLYVVPKSGSVYAGRVYRVVPKKRYPNFIFAITAVNVHRF